jgi:hypothetical protein
LELRLKALRYGDSRLDAKSSESHGIDSGSRGKVGNSADAVEKELKRRSLTANDGGRMLDREHYQIKV